MTDINEAERQQMRHRMLCLLKILKFSAAKGLNFDDKLRQSVFKSAEMKRDIKAELILKAIN